MLMILYLHSGSSWCKLLDIHDFLGFEMIMKSLKEEEKFKIEADIRKRGCSPSGDR